MNVGLAAVLAAALVAVALIAAASWSTWRAWKRLSRTTDAAAALIDVHLAALDDRTEATAAAIESFAESSERAADGWTNAIAGVRELGMLASTIGRERSRLRREVLDLLLPTSRRQRDRD